MVNAHQIRRHCFYDCWADCWGYESLVTASLEKPILRRIGYTVLSRRVTKFLSDMAPYVVSAPRQRIVTDELFDAVLLKVTSVSKLHQPVTVHLAGANLQFRHLQKLAKHFEQTDTRVFALDMSMNRIQADWASLEVEVNRLMGPRLVWYLDLGMNYLPAISSLDQSVSVRHKFLQLEQRLSLGLDCDSYTGVPDVDRWITNARTFKTEAYGITEFAENPDEI